MYLKFTKRLFKNGRRQNSETNHGIPLGKNNTRKVALEIFQLKTLKEKAKTICESESPTADTEYLSTALQAESDFKNNIERSFPHGSKTHND